MPHLTEAALRAIKPSGKVERFYDTLGLYLELSKAGGKLWRWKYRFEGKEKRLSCFYLIPHDMISLHALK